MKTRKTAELHIRMKPEIKKRLEAYAHMRGKTITDTVEEIIINLDFDGAETNEEE